MHSALMERSNRNHTHTEKPSYPNFHQKLNFANTTSAGNSQNMTQTPHLLDARLKGTMNTKPPLGLKCSLSAMEERGDTRHNMNSSRAIIKFTAENSPALLLKIGQFNFIPQYPGDLWAKFHYKRKKIIWEIFDRSQNRKFKVEVPWYNIFAIQAVFNENGPEILEFELEKVPDFHKEIDSEPPKHTAWELSKEDFTGGHAKIYRIHHLEFSPGVLRKHYPKMLQSDKRLLELSQQPFPRFSSRYFGPPLLSEDISDYNKFIQQPSLLDEAEYDLSNLVEAGTFYGPEGNNYTSNNDSDYMPGFVSNEDQSMFPNTQIFHDIPHNQVANGNSMTPQATSYGPEGNNYTSNNGSVDHYMPGFISNEDQSMFLNTQIFHDIPHNQVANGNSMAPQATSYGPEGNNYTSYMQGFVSNEDQSIFPNTQIFHDIPHNQVANGNSMTPQASYHAHPKPEMEPVKWIYRGVH